MSDLDPLQLERARQVLRSKALRRVLLDLPDREFLEGLEEVRDGRVMAHGFLLFARCEVLARTCPQAQFHHVLHDSETYGGWNDIDRLPPLGGRGAHGAGFTGPLNPEREIALGLFKLRVPQYPPRCAEYPERADASRLTFTRVKCWCATGAGAGGHQPRRFVAAGAGQHPPRGGAAQSHFGQCAGLLRLVESSGHGGASSASALVYTANGASQADRRPA